MSQPEWRIRTARKKDRELLSRFACADPKVPWELEVESFIQQSLCDWAFDKFARHNDPRLLLLFHRVFAIVHEGNSRSIAALVRHGLAEELSRVDPSYRRLVTAQR